MLVSERKSTVKPSRLGEAGRGFWSREKLGQRSRKILCTCIIYSIYRESPVECRWRGRIWSQPLGHILAKLDYFTWDILAPFKETLRRN